MPFCVTVTEWPATVSVAVRGDVAAFAETTIVAVPSPDPLPVSDSHCGAPDDDQAHPPGAATVSVVVPPVIPTAMDAGETM